MTGSAVNVGLAHQGVAEPSPAIAVIVKVCDGEPEAPLVTVAEQDRSRTRHDIGSSDAAGSGMATVTAGPVVANENGPKVDTFDGSPRPPPLLSVMEPSSSVG